MSQGYIRGPLTPIRHPSDTHGENASQILFVSDDLCPVFPSPSRRQYECRRGAVPLLYVPLHTAHWPWSNSLVQYPDAPHGNLPNLPSNRTLTLTLTNSALNNYANLPNRN